MSQGVSVECSSRVESDGEDLQAIDVREWIYRIPDGATITAITRDVGSQRDPYIVTRGLLAKWSEVRRPE